MQINFDWSSWLYVMITRHCILLKMQVPLSLFHFEICSTVFSMYIYFLQIQMNALLHHVKMGDLVWTLGAVTAVFVWTDGQEWTVPLLVTLNDYDFFNTCNIFTVDGMYILLLFLIIESMDCNWNWHLIVKLGVRQNLLLFLAKEKKICVCEGSITI